MKERFEGDGKRLLLDAIRRQVIVDGDTAAAGELVAAGTLHEFALGTTLIKQDGEDDDVYFIIAGAVAIIVNGNNVGMRKTGESVGEMAAVEYAQKRAADVVATETVVTLKVGSAAFYEICEKYPRIWLAVARELSKRLFGRNKLIAAPNENPSLFIISSSEAIPVARQLQLGLKHDVLSTVWTDGVFFAGGYPLESLETAVAGSDFAVAIAQPDDIVSTRGTTAPTLRDNVLFELGLFMGKLSRYRTILVHPRVKDLKLPSDLSGLNMISYQPDGGKLDARLAPVCTEIANIVKRLGVHKVIG